MNCIPTVPFKIKEDNGGPAELKAGWEEEETISGMTGHCWLAFVRALTRIYSNASSLIGNRKAG